MRKLVFAIVVICFACFGSLNAQITITSSSMPASGDTLRYSTASPLNIDSTWMARGGNQNWDFSTLSSIGQGLYEYKSANKTPYAFYFFGQIGQKTADSLGGGPFLFKNIYSFYSKTTSVFKTEGLGYSYSGIPLASKYTDEDEIYQFPLQYNDSDVSTFHFVFSIPGQTLFSFVQGGTRTNVVDAWGSIKTPYKTYSDVIRVMTLVDEVDTLVSQFTKFPIVRKQVSYKFLATTEKIPVLEVVGTLSVNGSFTPTVINYRDKYIASPNAGNNDIQNKKMVYPNPTKGKVFFEGHSSVENIQIIDALGKVVSKKQFSFVVSNNVLQVDIASLPDGVYFVEINNSVYRIVKQQ
jgi:hypothetical protein